MRFNENEYFGEEELVEGNKHGYTVICDSIEGELLMVKRNLFLSKVIGDSGGRKYMNEHISQKK